MLQPVGNRLLIEPKDPETKSKGGLVLEVKDDKQDSGTVIAVGEDLIGRFKAGDFVFYLKYGPQSVKYDGKEYVIVHLDEVLGIERK